MRILILLLILPFSLFGQGVEPSQIQYSTYKDGFLRATIPIYDDFEQDTVYYYAHVASSVQGMVIDSIVYSNDSLRIYTQDTTFITEIIGGVGGGLDGVGLANRIAYWKSADTITFDSAMYWDKTNKRLGFNTTTPTRTVDIEGRMRLNQDGNIFINGGNTTVTGNNNVGVGNNAIDEVTTGSNNFAMGISSLTEMKTGSQNVGLGNQSLRENESGDDNVGIGYESLYSYEGSQTVAIGRLAGSDAEGDGNVFIGHNAGRFSNGGEKLHIDNSSTGTPLIGGEFAKNRVGINKDVQSDTLKATLHVGGTVIVDSRSGTVNKYAGFDSSGKLIEFTPTGGGADSTVVTAGYGITVTETTANTWTVSADTTKIATLYDVSQVDQSATNEIQNISTNGTAGNISISSGSTLTLNVNDADANATNELQKIDTFQIFDINKLRISLQNDGEAAKVVTLPTTIDSTIVTQGYGITVTESPTNTYNIKSDTSKMATLYDLSLVDQSATNEIQVIDTFQIFDTNKIRISLSNDGQAAKVITLPTGTTSIDSTVVVAGYGLTASESPANTWNIASDSTKLATQFDISGFVDGTGTATRPAIWSDANTLTSDSNLDWNNTDKRLLVGPNTAATTPNKLQVVGTGTTGQYIIQVENEANVTSAGGINIFGNNSNTSFIPLNTNASTTGNVIINNTNSNTGGGGAYINTSVNGTTGDAYLITQKASGTAWSLGMKQSNSYAGRFTISESSTLTSAAERLSIGTGGVIRIKSLDTDASAPATSGTTRAVITDGNGDLSFTTFPSGGIDSTVVSAGYGLTSSESPANTFTVSADTSKLVTQYDLSLVDQSATNEIQTIDTFQIFDTNKLRISLTQDNQPAKVITLPVGSVTIDSTIVTGGWGVDVAESPLNTFTVKADTAEVATQFDISGFVSGSGTATRPAFWTGTKTLGSDSNFDWDNTNKKLSLGTGFLESAFRLHVGGNPASTTGLATFEHSGTTNGAAVLNIAHNGSATNQIFTVRSSGFTSGNLINEQKNNDTNLGSSLYRALVSGTGDSYFQAGKVSGNNWSWGFKQSDSYAGRFTLSYSSNLAAANEMFSMSTSGVTRIKSLQTGLTAPSTSGTTRMVITDSNGDLSFTTIPTAGVTGTGTANYMTYWNTGTTIAGTSIAYGTSFVGLGFGVAPASVTHALHINNDALRLQGTATIIDKNNSGGANGHVLSGTGGSGVQWRSLSDLGADVSNTNEIQNISTNGTAGNISISSGSTLTLNVNDADASTTNELQTLSHTSNSTSHTMTLSNSGGSLILTEGDGIALSTSSNNVTIASTSPSGWAELSHTTDVSLTGVTTTPIKMNFTSGTWGGNLSSDSSTDRLTNGQGSGTMKITFSGSFETNDQGTLTFSVYKNGTAIGYKGDIKVYTHSYAEDNLFSKTFTTSTSLNDYFELYLIDAGDAFNTIDLRNVVFMCELIY